MADYFKECGELDDAENISNSIDNYPRNEENYHKVGGINSTMSRNYQQPGSILLNDDPKIQIGQSSKSNLPSQGSDSKLNMKQITNLSTSPATDCQTSTGALKKSTSKITLDSR